MGLKRKMSRFTAGTGMGFMKEKRRSDPFYKELQVLTSRMNMQDQNHQAVDRRVQDIIQDIGYLRVGFDQHSAKQEDDCYLAYIKDDEGENTSEQLVHRDNGLSTDEYATVPVTSDVPSTGLTTDEQQSTGDIDISYAIVRVRVKDSARI